MIETDLPLDDPVFREQSREFHLAEYWAILRRHWKVVALCIAAVLALAIVYSSLSRPLFRSTTTLLLEHNRTAALPLDALRDLRSDPEFLPTQMRLMKSRAVAERVVRRFGLVSGRSSGDAADAVTRAALGVQSRVETKIVRGTNLVELSYVAGTPVQAADYANAIAEGFLEWDLESGYRAVEQSSEFLGGQIEKLRGEVSQQEQQLLAYGRQKDIISVDPGTNVTLQKLESLNRDYASAVADRVAKEARWYESRTAPPESVAEGGSSAGTVAQLRNEISRLERDYAEKLNLYKPEWPAMQQLKSQIDSARTHLESVVSENVRKAQDVARSDYLTALRRESSLKQVLEAQKSEAQDLSSNAVEYNNLRIEIETKRQLLDSLMKKQAETAVASNLRGQRATNFRIVELALPPRRPFAPSIRKNVALAMVGGTALGFAMVLLLSYLDRSLRTPAQVEQALHLPSLGMIPSVGEGGIRTVRAVKALVGRAEAGPAPAAEPIELAPHARPRSAVAESYRSLRASLLLSRAGGIKSMLITSARPGEGKTATATNLATVLAQLGKPVLLIDADLHRPRLHEVFRVSNRAGLVSILAEKLDPMAAITKTSVPGLSLLPSGPSTPNPSGLLASEAMRTLLEYAGMNFEYVVVDAPPMFPVADALLLGPQTDGVVLCVQWGRTPREHVSRACEALERGRVTVLGAVLNGVAEAMPGYGAGYGEYYGTADGSDDAAGAVAGQRG